MTAMADGQTHTTFTELDGSFKLGPIADSTYEVIPTLKDYKFETIKNFEFKAIKVSMIAIKTVGFSQIKLNY